MLTNKRLFARLMALLRSIDKKSPFPPTLEAYLWDNMVEEPLCKIMKEMESQGSIHKKAYYIVNGYMIVTFINAEGSEHMIRIYDKNSIVAMNSFMEQSESPYSIRATKDTVLLSISHKHMEHIYKTIPGVLELANKTALSYESKELLREQLLNQPCKQRVIAFYTVFDGLRKQRRLIKDAMLASYLLMNVSTLREIRSEVKI